MSQEIYQDGKLLYTLTSTDGSKCDVVTMPKILVQNSSLTSEGFDQLFFTFLKGNVSHTEAYYEAEKVHEHYFGQSKYSSYESFKTVYYRNLKK